MNPCHVNARCTDSEGSFVCQCDVGFSGDGFSCSSKCLTQDSKHHARRKREQCTVFVVVCVEMHRLTMVFCHDYSIIISCFIDIDECLSNPCHTNASCTDTEGSFHCQCNPGFSGDGISNCASKPGIFSFSFVFPLQIFLFKSSQG